MQPPDFWYNQKSSLLSFLLAPVGWIYGLTSAIQQDRATPWQAPVPIICIGNLVAGGQGKTPTALSFGSSLRAHGKNIHFLSRGYGGSLKGPLQVNLNSHTAAEVGDEPLLLAATSPSWISIDRQAGIEAAYKAGAEIIVMDDGFQNPSIKKDLSVIVIDGETGFGNGRLIPAGPLREGVTVGLARAQALIIIGNDKFNLKGGLSDIATGYSHKKIKIFTAKLKPENAALKLQGKKIYAFAGIGRPKKFFETLLEIGCNLIGAKAFADHHLYTKKEISSLLNISKREEATLVTTAKDHVRVPPFHKKDIVIVSVTLDWTDTSALDRLLKPFI
ncbi:MAG: tetraacyldisaccharide 4'-kinase [Rhodospirillales bacterium]|jgi:tetraacyldisaccharide 4'-kinase